MSALGSRFDAAGWMDMLHWTSLEKGKKRGGTCEETEATCDNTAQSSRIPVSVTGNLHLDVCQKHSKNNLTAAPNNSWSWVFNRTIFILKLNFANLAWDLAFKLNPSEICKPVLFSYFFGPPTKKLQKRSSDSLTWAWELKIRSESRLTRWGEELTNEWISVFELSCKSHGNQKQIGGRSSADYHYIRAWFGDYGAHNRPCWSHNYRNQQLPLRGWELMSEKDFPARSASGFAEFLNPRSLTSQFACWFSHLNMCCFSQETH